MNKKLTKILATIPNDCDEAFIRTLHESGMDAVRLNTAHQSPEQALEVIRVVRAVSPHIAILIDTKGPEVRTRNIDAPIKLEAGETCCIMRDGIQPPMDTKSFEVSYPAFIDELSEGNPILIDDGQLELVVREKQAGHLLCEACNTGEIKKNKSINTPTVNLSQPTLQEKDLEFIDFAILNDIDFIAHSFVRSKEDVLVIQQLLDEAGSQIRIIAKIENLMGVQNLDEILDHTAGVMVARGDLGVEVPLERLPGIQKHIIQSCTRRAKIAITATQMLHSMIENPRPTRAEVSDVANAVYDGTDVLMLSGETAYGKYPIETVRTMARIAAEAEGTRPNINLHSAATNNQIRAFIASMPALAAEKIPIKAVIADTETGRIASILSSYRMKVPIYAKSAHARTVNALALSYGVFPALMEAQPSTDHMVRRSIASLMEEDILQPEDLVMVVGGSPAGYSGATNFAQIVSAFAALGE